jgi:hypothetical protein
MYYKKKTFRCVHAIPYYRNVNTIGDSMVLHGHIDFIDHFLIFFFIQIKTIHIRLRALFPLYIRCIILHRNMKKNKHFLHKFKINN